MFVLVRWPNLLMLTLVQGVAGYSLCHTTPLLLTGIIVMTVLAAASGYVINNILDQHADSLNGRANPIVQERMSEEHAWRLYRILVALGACIAVILAFTTSLHFSWVYLFMVGLLWSYTGYLKGTHIIGNLSVSVLCGLAVLIVGIPFTDHVPDAMVWLAGFAFALTLVREIVKDLEDMDGDRKAGYKTLPVASGTKIAKSLSLGISIVILVCLMLPGIFPSEDRWWQIGLWGTTVFLLAYSGIFAIIRADSHEQYHRSSILLKIAMLTGTFFLIF